MPSVFKKKLHHIISKCRHPEFKTELISYKKKNKMDKSTLPCNKQRLLTKITQKIIKLFFNTFIYHLITRRSFPCVPSLEMLTPS